MSALQLSQLKELSFSHLVEVRHNLENIYPQNIINSIFFPGLKYDEMGEGSASILNPFLDQTYLDKIYENIIIKNNWSIEEITTMKEIIQYLNFIDNTLKPLKQLDIHCDIAIAGGAIRDFYTHQHKSIKDLDIVIYMYSSSLIRNEEDIKNGLDIYKFKKEYDRIKPLLDILVIPEFKEDLNSSATIMEQFIFHIIKHTISQKIEIEKEFAPKGNKPTKNSAQEQQPEKESTTTYIHELLRGVIKLKPHNNGFPVDILISNASINDYIEAFDFGICQTYLSAWQMKESIQDINNVKDYEVVNIINNLYFHQNFINDVIYKKLTFLLPHSALENIEKNFETHLPRLMKKYPEHKIGIINRNYNYEKEENNQITYTIAMNEIIDNLFKNHTDKIFLFLRDTINYINLSEEINKKVPITNKISKKKKL